MSPGRADQGQQGAARVRERPRRRHAAANRRHHPGHRRGPERRAVIVWQEATLAPSGSAIAFSKSLDGGATWSAPSAINTRPDVQAFTPSVEALADGTIGVTHYDLGSTRRPSHPADRLLVPALARRRGHVDRDARDADLVRPASWRRSPGAVPRRLRRPLDRQAASSCRCSRRPRRPTRLPSSSSLSHRRAWMGGAQ